MYKVVVGADHAGWSLKQEVVSHLNILLGFRNVVDLSENKPSPNDDYPKIAEAVANIVANAREDSLGVLICGTGMGMAIAANKIKGIRAAACYTVSTAILAREHNSSNILCLGGRIIAGALAIEIVDAWLETPFLDEESHRRRVSQIAELEVKQGFLEGYVNASGSVL